MDEIKEHIINREWQVDSKEEKKCYYLKIAHKCSKGNKIEDLISGVLLYSQLVEQALKETIILSIIYIKAKIWPEKSDMNLNFSKATFGTQIDFFKKFAIKIYNRETIIKYLDEIVITRNKIIHNIFDFEETKNELNDYFGKSDELFYLLIEYYNAIAEKIFAEMESFNFDVLI